MSTGATIAIGVVVLFVLLVVFLATASLRRDRADAVGVLSRETRKRDRSNEALEQVVPEEAAPADRPRDRAGRGARALRRRRQSRCAAGRRPSGHHRAGRSRGLRRQTRRQFLNRGILGMMVVAISGFGAAVHRLPVADPDERLRLQDQRWAPSPTSRRSPTPSSPSTTPRAGSTSTRTRPIDVPGQGQEGLRRRLLIGMEQGWVALYQKCVHLGCRVPWCQSSQWFECPCHGSKYNRVGEKKGGPAPRGLDRFALSVSNDVMVRSTPRPCISAPRSAPTPPARARRDRIASDRAGAGRRRRAPDLELVTGAGAG